MSYGHGFGGEDIKEESGWRYPLTIFFITLGLCAIFLYNYVGPSGSELLGNTPKPTISDQPITAVIGETPFTVPSSYTVFPRDRRDGERKALALYVFWPTLSGYSPARRMDFIENKKDSRRIDINIFQRRTPFNESERIEYLYMPQVIDKRGEEYKYGLTKFTFKDRGTNTETNGFSGRDLFLGPRPDGSESLIVLFCYKEDGILPADCYREYELNEKVSVKYIFKRAYLAEWAKIDAQIRQFITKLNQQGEQSLATTPSQN